MGSFKNLIAILIFIIALSLSFILSSMLVTIISYDLKALFNLLQIKSERFNIIFSASFILFFVFYAYLFIRNALSSIFYEEKFVDEQMRLSIKIFIFAFINSLLIAVASFAKIKMTNTNPLAYLLTVLFATFLSFIASKLVYAYFANKFEKLEDFVEEDFDEDKLKYEAKRRAKQEEKNVWKR